MELQCPKWYQNGRYVTLVVMNIECNISATKKKMMIVTLEYLVCQLTCGVLHAPMSKMDGAAPMSKMDGASTKKQKIADDIGIEPMAFRLTVKRSTN
jgi:hypothetical protein